MKHIIIKRFFGFLLLHQTLAASHWRYPDMTKEEEFPHWGGMCDTGKHQSPINLSVKGALKGDFPRLNFENYDEVQEGLTLINNGHSILMSNFSNEMELNGGPLTDEYTVEQIHFHWWSEHTIDDIRYPLEAHIVHRNKRYDNMSEAIKYKDGVTVVGILYHVSLTKNSGIEKIADNLEFIKNASNINIPVEMDEEFKINELLPEVQGYLTYAGSLTTPTCAESVTWIVLLDTFPVTLEQVKQFREIEHCEGEKLEDNYRQIQKKYNRPIVVVFGENEDEEKEDVDDGSKNNDGDNDTNNDDDDDDDDEDDEEDNTSAENVPAASTNLQSMSSMLICVSLFFLSKIYLYS